MDLQEELQSRLRAVTIVAMGIIGSLAVYLGLVEVLRAADRPFRGFAAIVYIQPLRYAVFGAAAAVIVLIRVLRPLLLRRRPGEDGKTSIQRLQRTALVTLILGEIPGILGLGLFLLSGHNIDFYVLLFASLLLVFIYFPRRADWEAWLRNASS